MLGAPPDAAMLSPSPSSPATRIPRLRYRPLAQADFPECLSLLPPWLDLDPTTHAALPGAWQQRFLNEPALITMVMEDLAEPLGQRIQSWGVSIALNADHIKQLQLDTAPPAHVTRRVYRALIDGSMTPMGDRDLGLANAQGQLHLLSLHWDMKGRDLSDPYVLSVLNISNECFRAGHAGYFTQSMYFEGSELDAPMVAAAGFPHHPYADPQALQALPPVRRPMLFGIGREAARGSLPGSSVRTVFEHHAPLFRFSASQRRLLWLALYDDSDDNLGRVLDASTHGLKKLWRGIYERIQDQQPDFFGDDDSTDGKRGTEKRRQVLAYVRQRPEELRPWATP
jgi:hypothetical protein